MAGASTRSDNELMYAQPNLLSERPAQRARSGGRTPVAGFPGVTHLVAAVALAVWFVGMLWRDYGIDREGGWWPRDNWTVLVVLLALSLVVTVPAVALEAVLVLRVRQRWLSRTVVVVHAYFAWCICFFLALFRLVGDDSPASGDFVAVGLASFALVMSGQALLTWVVCRWWLRRAAKPSSQA